MATETHERRILCPRCAKVLRVDWKALPPPAPSQNGAGWWMACGNCQHKWWVPAPDSQEHRESLQKLKALLRAFDESVSEEAEAVTPTEEEKPSVNEPALEPVSKEPEPPLVQVVKEEAASSFDWEALLGDGAKALSQEDPFSGCKGLSFTDWLEAQKVAAQQDTQVKAGQREKAEAEERSLLGKPQAVHIALTSEREEQPQIAGSSEDSGGPSEFKEIPPVQPTGSSWESEDQRQSLEGGVGYPGSDVSAFMAEKLETSPSEERRKAFEVPSAEEVVGPSSEAAAVTTSARKASLASSEISSDPHRVAEQPSLAEDVSSHFQRGNEVQTSSPPKEESQTKKESSLPKLQEDLGGLAFCSSSSSELSSRTSQDSPKPVTEQDLQALKNSLVQAFRDELAQVAKLTTAQMKDPRNQELLASKKGSSFFPKKPRGRTSSAALKPHSPSRSSSEESRPQLSEEAASQTSTLESPASDKAVESESVQGKTLKEAQPPSFSSPQERSSDPVLSPRAFAADRLPLTAKTRTSFDLSRDKVPAFWLRFKEKLLARPQGEEADKSWPYEKGAPCLPLVLPKAVEKESIQDAVEKEAPSGEVIAVHFPLPRQKVGSVKAGPKWPLFHRLRKKKKALPDSSEKMKGELLHFSPLGAGAKGGVEEPQSLNSFLQNATKTSGRPSGMREPFHEEAADEDGRSAEMFPVQTRKPSEEGGACIAVTGTGAPPVLIPFPEGTEEVRTPELPGLPTRRERKALSARAKLGLTMGVTGLMALVALAVTIRYKETARSLWEGTIPQTASPKPDSVTLSVQPPVTSKPSCTPGPAHLETQKASASFLPEEGSVPGTLSRKGQEEPLSEVGDEAARTVQGKVEEVSGSAEAQMEVLPDSAPQAGTQAPEMVPPELSPSLSEEPVPEAMSSALPAALSEAALSGALGPSETTLLGGAKTISAEALPKSLSLEQVGYTVMTAASEGQATESLLPRVVVTGEIVNLTEEGVLIPPILISITSLKWPGKLLYSGRYSHSTTELLAHGRSPFQIEKGLPVDEDEDLKIELSFAPTEVETAERVP